MTKKYFAKDIEVEINGEIYKPIEIEDCRDLGKLPEPEEHFDLVISVYKTENKKHFIKYQMKDGIVRNEVSEEFYLAFVKEFKK